MAFRLTTRVIPDALQAAVATGVKIGQSRLTFSGARGVVIVLWAALFINTDGTAKDRVQIQVTGTATPLRRVNGNNWFDAGAARNLTIFGMQIIIDPPAGSFMELETDFVGGGTLDVASQAGTLMAMSIPTEEGGGPIVTIE